jgi:hypothetical protein
MKRNIGDGAAQKKRATSATARSTANATATTASLTVVRHARSSAGVRRIGFFTRPSRSSLRAFRCRLRSTLASRSFAGNCEKRRASERADFRDARRRLAYGLALQGSHEISCLRLLFHSREESMTRGARGLAAAFHQNGFHVARSVNFR